MKLATFILLLLLIPGFPVFRRLHFMRPDLLYVPVPRWWDYDLA